MIDLKLKNKKVILTGGSRGIGLSILEKLYALGSEVLIIGSNQENLDKVKKNIPVYMPFNSILMIIRS